LPDELTNISSLKKLNLSNNELTALPESIGNLNNLEELTLNHQSKQENNETIRTLTSIPLSTKDLTKLITFNASTNKLSGLIDLSGTNTLRYLNLNDNEVEDLKLGDYVTGVHVSYNISQNPFITCVEVPTSAITHWTNGLQRDNGVAISDSCSGYRVPQTERQALIDLYNATGGGDTWTGTNWDTDPTRLTNVGSWQGVTTELINGQKHVTKLSLSGKGLKGDIPASIKDLPELTEINLTGDIYVTQTESIQSLPKEIGELSKLERLSLGNNDLSSLPDEISNLSSLTYLWLRNNSLTSLPTTIGSFTKLEELYLDGQRDHTSNNAKTLTSLPNEIGSIGTLKKLDLNN
ncbi:hypothetical protein WH52_14680, partial [Tenacibaculum holothuriorum]